MLNRLLTQAGSAMRIARQWGMYDVFLARDYQQHTIARLDHLDSLGLDIRGKRVLEVGAGIGEHTLFYLHRGCEVVPTDARPELVAFLRERFGLAARHLDVEKGLDRLSSFGQFDILHCYGLLYHISNPQEFLQASAPVADLLVLETCVAPGTDHRVEVVEEDRENIWEAAHGRGCLPTRPWLFATLKEYYPYVYCPMTQPRHREFPLDWSEDAPEPAGLVRAIFLASHRPISRPLLVDALPKRYIPW
jgi:SAM-dependent methyltransferase